ncbi:hypothetical protein ZIOFF_067546 [Zingiber officinale]|uniref:Uncharacterized protein n=1 Tax=Zingiber officinale TaxID=94328 RepID=A0A8J5EE26_ZINOF|nr:hypothetical protein ZIOFF_067546 [Zingiber officinale]
MPERVNVKVHKGWVVPEQARVREPFECYSISDIEDGLGLKRKQLIAIALLAGNDHLHGVPRYHTPCISASCSEAFNTVVLEVNIEIFAMVNEDGVTRWIDLVVYDKRGLERIGYPWLSTKPWMDSRTEIIPSISPRSRWKDNVAFTGKDEDRLPSNPERCCDWCFWRLGGDWN